MRIVLLALACLAGICMPLPAYADMSVSIMGIACSSPEEAKALVEYGLATHQTDAYEIIRNYNGGDNKCVWVEGYIPLPELVGGYVNGLGDWVDIRTFSDGVEDYYMVVKPISLTEV